MKRDRSSPTAVETILSNALKQAGLDERIARYDFVLHWPQIVGEEIAKRTRPECIRGRCLVVRVIDSVWAQELSFQKQVILKRLQRFVDAEPGVKDISFYVAGQLSVR